MLANDNITVLKIILLKTVFFLKEKSIKACNRNFLTVFFICSDNDQYFCKRISNCERCSCTRCKKLITICCNTCKKFEFTIFFWPWFGVTAKLIKRGGLYFILGRQVPGVDLYVWLVAGIGGIAGCSVCLNLILCTVMCHRRRRAAPQTVAEGTSHTVTETYV